MDAFPQLSTGSIAQYPARRIRQLRTVSNVAADGRAVLLADPDAGSIEWRLELSGLADAERTAIEDLFNTTRGRYGTFAFLDPFDNLLRWSEDLEQTVWQVGPQVSLTPGKPDPLGSTRATGVYNGAATAQQLTQTLEAPANFQYVWSLYARSDSSASLTLEASAGGSNERATFSLTPIWRRCVLPAKLDSTAESVVFALELPSGDQADVFGLQVEAQPGCSTYKRTGSVSGVYGEARFAEDVLRVTALGADNHSVTTTITTAWKG